MTWCGIDRRYSLIFNAVEPIKRSLNDRTRHNPKPWRVRWRCTLKLTMDRIRNLACPAGKRDRLVFDDEQRGLGVRVTAGGSKSYLVQFTFEGQKRRVPLGSCSAIALADARIAARAVMGDVAKGVRMATGRCGRGEVSVVCRSPLE
jgi:hypothetical protein